MAGHYLSLAVAGQSDWPQRFLGTAARIAGVEARSTGTVAPSPLLLLANHLSWIDILVLAGTTASAFVAHDGLSQQGFLRWLCRLNRTVFIARDRRGSVAAQTGQLREALAQGEVLTLFPEGTTGNGVTLRRFKSSLLAAVVPPRPGLSVQPVLIDYGRAAREIAWTDAEHGLRNFLRILGRARRLPVTLRFLPVLTGGELQDRKTMAAAAEQAIAGAMR